MARNKTVNIGNVNASLDERTGYIRLTSKAKGALKDNGFVVNVKPDSEEHFLLLGEIEGKHGEIENLDEITYRAPRTASKPYELWGPDKSYEIHPSRIPIGEDTRNGKVSHWRPAKERFGDSVIMSSHMLITGGTGMGKSTIIANIVEHLNFFPEQVQMFYSNGKGSDELMSHYVSGLSEDSFHSYGATDVSIFSDALKIMKERYELMDHWGVTNLDELISVNDEKRTYLILDGAQELLLSSKHRNLAHNLLSDLLEHGRAAGIHVILATQVADFVTDDMLKAIGSRIHCKSPRENGIRMYRASFETWGSTHDVVPYRVHPRRTLSPRERWDDLLSEAENVAYLETQT